MGAATVGVPEIEELIQSLAPLLTPEEMEIWESFESDPAYYQAERRYASQLTDFLPGLSSENRAVAASVLAEEYLAATGASDNNPDQNVLTRSWLRTIETLERARPRVAETFPDDEQFALFDDFVAQQQALIQAQIDRYDESGTFFFATEDATLFLSN